VASQQNNKPRIIELKSYGETAVKDKKLVRFDIDKADNNNDSKRSKIIGNESVGTQSHIWVNDIIENKVNRLKNNSFYSDMGVSFIEQSGLSKEGIYARQVIDHKHIDDAIIRKSIYQFGPLLDDKDNSKVSRPISKYLIRKYKQISNGKNDKVEMQSQNRDSEFYHLDMQTQLEQMSNVSQKDDSILDFDKVSLINIEGKSKLQIETTAVDNLKGPKYLVKNHVRTKFGEDEPYEDEEILAFHK